MGKRGGVVPPLIDALSFQQNHEILWCIVGFSRHVNDARVRVTFCSYLQHYELYL